MPAPSIITATQLRSVLGVSSALYSDSYLEGIINSAEEVLLPLLTAYQSAITGVYAKDLIAYYSTQSENYFVEGQTVVITGCTPSGFNGTVTITDSVIEPYRFSTATAIADMERITPVIPAGVAYVSALNAATLYASTPAIESAVTIISVEIFQSITAAGGQIEGVDFQPSPFKMGRSLQNRVIGLIGNYVDVSTMAQ